MSSSARKGQGKDALSSKEGSNFRQMIQCYERKQYKRGLKLADGILKKHKDHGETMAMKGLILNALKRSEEARELIRAGLKNDLRSHVCWHVYGLFHRSTGDYAEAVKAYSQALRLDPENMQILRDQGLLQMQIRDIKGFSETQRKLLSLKGSNKLAWVGFAVGHHVAGNTGLAVEVLSQYEGTLDAAAAASKEEAKKSSYDLNELVLYKSRILEEDEQYEKALEELTRNTKKIRDRPAAAERQATILTKLGRFDEAMPLWRYLLKDINPENYNYHRGLQACILEKPEYATVLRRNELVDSQQVSGTLSNSVYNAHSAARGTQAARGCELPVHREELSDALVDTFLQLYNELHEENPRCKAVKRIPLTFLPASHAEFKSQLDEYLKAGINKGVYSLAQDIKSLYENQDKVKVLESLLLDNYLDSAQRAFTAIKNYRRTNVSDPSLENYEPCTCLWSFYMASNHHLRLGNLEKALELIDTAIEHTPTTIELYMTKARILKKLGRIQEAAELLLEATKLDLADRYINTKCVKYLFRAGRQEEANENASLFARQEGDPMVYLVDLQTIWFELEAAKSYETYNNVAMALKRFGNTLKHFEDFKEDQFDFHQYCLRRMTLRSYIDFLFLEERWRRHPFFVQAASGMARCWLRLHLDPSLKRDVSRENGEYTEEEWAAMSASEKKKAKQKMRKEKAKKKKNEDSNKATENETEDSENKAKNKKTDDDAEGKSYLKEENPLQKAYEVVCELVKNAPDVAETQALAAHVAALRNKPLQAIKHLRDLKSSTGDISHLSPEKIAQVVNETVKNAQEDSNLSEATLEMIREYSGDIEQITSGLQSISVSNS
eukprot:gb/GECG01012981.1/.p1 GENE.gb/GECG01012981.1/~~gb/GECG01012981.1/.p1  ORF type:complete len:840 (+),score=142.50 gb/GECG01012981.1/:1-2520(+)